MKFALLLQTFEIIHPLLGFVPRGGFLPALILISGRLFMFFAMISAEPRMHSKPAVTYLFAVYTAIELVRYPYYMLKVGMRRRPTSDNLQSVIIVPPFEILI